MSLTIKIQDPHINSHAKFMKVMSILSKATKVDFSLDNHTKSEPTPYTSLRELADEISLTVENRLFLVWSHIVKNWLQMDLKKAGDDSLPMKLNGKILIDPKSGKRLTRAQWKMIKADLTKMFTWLYGDSDERLTYQAIALGKVIQQLDPDTRITAPLKDQDVDLHAEVISKDAMYDNIFSWAEENTGELIVDVTNRSRKAIVQTIMQAYQDGKNNKQLQKDLFEQFGAMNRDWRRIAETETATNFNNGYLMSEIKDKKDDQSLFMIGITGAGACEFCASHVSDHVVVLLEDSPGGDSVTIDGRTYTAIWPGKSNAGRKRADWWVASGSQHPHCRCTWTRYFPEIEEYTRKLKQATGA